ERIALLRQPPLPKRPSEDNTDENYFPTRIIDNAKQQRNAKIDHVKELIRDFHTKSKDGKTLLDVLYYIW
ncbi:5675_t:CDS:2, partial [Racocetra fulgida]